MCFANSEPYSIICNASFSLLFRSQQRALPTGENYQQDLHRKVGVCVGGGSLVLHIQHSLFLTGLQGIPDFFSMILRR